MSAWRAFSIAWCLMAAYIAAILVVQHADDAGWPLVKWSLILVADLALALYLATNTPRPRVVHTVNVRTAPASTGATDE